MMNRRRHSASLIPAPLLLVGALLLFPPSAVAQVTPAAGYTPPDDTPSIKLGVTLFTDYTVQQKPKVLDANGKEITFNQFNIGRTYINVTGNLTHRIAFRITPDVTRETGAGSSLNGSYSFRLKYGFVQYNLDDWTKSRSWVRLGLQQTPFIDFMEGIYRYRFQGTIFEERDGFLFSSDAGATFGYTLAANYGDVHAGFYNGEGFAKFETGAQKGFMARGTFRPLHMAAVLRGLRVTGFYDRDASTANVPRRRGIVSVTFEHKYLNAAADYLAASDQTSITTSKVDARGYTIWATPRATNGWEGLVRYDHLKPNKDAQGTRTRKIAGVAYWFPHEGTVSTALLADVEQVDFDKFITPQPTQRRFSLHALVNF